MTRRPRAAASGFTLIEMMMAITIVGILLVLGVPALRGVVENTRIRANGESMKYGLDLARTEAVRLNTQIEFARTADGWVVRAPTADDSGAVMHAGSGKETSDDVTLTYLPTDSRRVTFDSLGRALATNPADGTPAITSVDVESTTPPTVDGYRPLRVQILPGGAARLCDPAVDDTDPRVCL